MATRRCQKWHLGRAPLEHVLSALLNMMPKLEFKRSLQKILSQKTGMGKHARCSCLGGHKTRQSEKLSVENCDTMVTEE